MTNTALTALFLQQSILDSQDDYHRSLTTDSFPVWDAVVITASNKAQADGYAKQIEQRKAANRLPKRTEFLIVPEEGDMRVGSAGSTLSVLRELHKRVGSFYEKRFLVIHAGGDSKRCPQYSAVGKLFSPVPMTIDGVPATLFDVFLLSMSSMPGRLKEGMLLLSGDVILLFNPLMCDFNSDAAIITFKEDAETGKEHGVCLRNEKTGNVQKFLHKLSIENLKEYGAVDERGNVNIDTGAVALCPEILDRLYELVANDADYHAIVNDRVRLSLYGDINYCLSEDATLEGLLQQAPEGEFCEELSAARKKLWDAIGSYSMKCMSLSPSKFTHFGSVPEILKLMDSGVEEYESLGWKKQINSSINNPTVAGYNSVLSDGASIGTGCYLEVSYVHHAAKIGNNCYLSFVDIHDEQVPDNVMLHGLKQSNGRFVCRIMGIDDNPKQDKIFGVKLDEISKILGVELGPTLWNAELYPECDTVKEAVAAALNLYRILVDKTGNVELWQKAEKKSLCSGFNAADAQAIIDWNNRMGDLVHMNELKKLITAGHPAREAANILKSDCLTRIQLDWVENELERLDTSKLPDFSYAMRLFYYLGVALGDEAYTGKCFKLIADTVLDATLQNLSYNDKAKIVSDETVIKLPLRTNWGGGWSDTCPHCLENGGTVLNAAIKWAGDYPVEVRLKKIPEKKVVFISNDMGVHGEFTEITELQKTGDPFDPFALQKACLLACGIIPKEGGNLAEILTRLGGGFEMHSEVINVPKGSGLGTSSILSAAAVKAMLTFCGIPFTDDTLYATVLAMEQIMSTGGGWQDQVGGVTPGIKFITSTPGIEQKIKVEKLDLSDSTKKELNDRFALIYTGQRRLARNLLRDVVGRYVGNEPESLTAHKEIQKSATLMRFALERGDVDELAKLLDEHWKLSQMIDAGSTNTLIDQIFMAIDDLIDARMCCGAGGGGFLQVMLKKGVTKQAVHQRLKDVFQDFAVDIWDAEIVYE